MRVSDEIADARTILEVAFEQIQSLGVSVMYDGNEVGYGDFQFEEET